MTDEFCTADTEYGKVRGVKVISEVDIPYWRFLGIPYAKPPVGELRFQKASKASPWDGVLDALKEPPSCAGRNSYIKKFVGSDDCLYLNVYTKNLKPDKLSPVLVYIHGGGFFGGSSTLHSYSPDYLLMHDIVVVIFNYRLGPLGFLSLKDKELNVPGNAGMKDQQMVLEFVRDNIENFGGDPQNVTLGGHSSGGFSVGLHCFSESSRDLFHRAIILGSPFFVTTPQLNWAERLAVKLGFDENIHDEKEILKFLEKVDAVKMAETAMGLLDPEEQKLYGISSPFWPNVDSSFLSKEPKDLFRDSWSNDIDILIGGVADEGAWGDNDFNKIPSLFPIELKSILSPEKLNETFEEWKTFYQNKFESDKDAYEKLHGDVFVWLSALRLIRARQKSGGKGKTFLHKFAIDSPTQNHYRIRWFGKEAKGVVHGDELCYFWKNGQGDVPSRDSMEFRAIETFTSILTNFITNSDPKIPNWHPGEQGITILPDKFEFNTFPEFERVHEFWEKLYEEAGVKFC